MSLTKSCKYIKTVKVINYSLPSTNTSPTPNQLTNNPITKSIQTTSNITNNNIIRTNSNNAINNNTIKSINKGTGSSYSERLTTRRSIHNT